MRHRIPGCSSSCYIAEGKVKATLSDLHRLIRLEEFLKDEQKAEGTKIILEWAESGNDNLRAHGPGGFEIHRKPLTHLKSRKRTSYDCTTDADCTLLRGPGKKLGYAVCGPLLHPGVDSAGPPKRAERHYGVPMSAHPPNGLKAVE